MTSQGSAHGRFQRGIRSRNLFQVELAIREMGALSLLDALGARKPVRWGRRLDRHSAKRPSENFSDTFTSDSLTTLATAACYPRRQAFRSRRLTGRKSIRPLSLSPNERSKRAGSEA